jgi:hypothetical protein
LRLWRGGRRLLYGAHGSADAYRQRHEWELERARRYRAANRRILSQRSLAYTSLRKQAEDPTYRVKMCCQTGWSKRCRRSRVFHAEPFLTLLGCTWEAFTRYIERRFKRGWNWSNFGSVWNLDHIQPINAFNLKRAENRAMVCHWSNLRPLSVEENRIKNGHYSKIELSLHKTMSRMTYGPKPKQPKFADRPDCPF